MKININKIKRAFGRNRSKAQHLVEFVLFFPFLIGIIGLLTEIAYGLNTGIELNSALNRALGAVSSIQRDETATKDVIEEELYQNTYEILVKRKVPYAKTLEVETLEVDDFLVSIATYEYTYAFNLVNTFFSAVPEKFHFKSVVISNKSLFAPNSYNLDEVTLENTFKNYSLYGDKELEDKIKDIYNNTQNTKGDNADDKINS